MNTGLPSEVNIENPSSINSNILMNEALREGALQTLNNVPIIYSTDTSPANVPNFPVTGLDSVYRPSAKRSKHSNTHMSHEFKKKLQSLLVYQKGKIFELSTKFTTWSNEWNKMAENSMFLPIVSDPVSVGILSKEEAELRLNLYKSEISEQCRLPFLKIADETTVDQLRSAKPVLFSVIMSSVSVVMSPSQTTRETMMKLDTFVLSLVSNQIFKANNKTVEVIEALLTLCLWYNFLEWSSKTRYHLFNYICCCLTKDLGPTFVNRSFAMFSDEDPCKTKANFKSPLELSKDGARLTIWVYVSSLNISIFLRQSIQSRYHEVTEKACRDIVEVQSQEDGLYDPMEDVMLVLFCKQNHILENIHVYLHEKDEPLGLEDDVEYRDNHIRKLIDKFQEQLNGLFKEIPADRHRVLSFHYSVEAYLHQYKVARYFAKLNEGETKTETLPEEIVEAFTQCYSCCTNSLKEFLKLPPKYIASLPLFHMSRIIYTVGLLLLKLRYSVVAIPSFHPLIPITEDAGPLVTKVTRVLEECSELFPFNNFLYKIQYVVALFSQTYANKVKEVAERHEANDSSNSRKQFNSQLLREPINASKMTDPKLNPITNLRIPIGSDVNNSILNVPGAAMSENDTNEQINSAFTNANVNSNNNANLSNTLTPPLFQPYDKNLSLVSGMKNSPTASSDNLNEYLTDMNSLAWGFNALNDEFWTDLFLDE